MRRTLGIILLIATGCAPAAAPLNGVLAPDRSLPPIQMPAGHRHIVFKWDYEEGEIAARGDGSIRTAAPDSARLDFFLGGGLGAGGAIPPLPDTVVRIDGDLTRADIGRPLQWRVALKGDTLVELDHISDGKIIESLTRDADGVLTFHVPGARRTLRLALIREETGSFDASIWSL